MAVIQKIRSYGVILIIVVGVALFAFIAEELVRAISTNSNSNRAVVGTVYGEKINYEEFNSLYSEYENAVKMGNGGQNLNEDQSTQLRDQVWQDLVSQRIVEHEAEALGLTVSDEELQSIINNGQSPILSQTPFVNQQTGQFDVNQLKQFLSQYDEVMNNADIPQEYKDQFRELKDYWSFIKRQVRSNALAQKYQSLLASCMLSNPVSAKASFEGRNNESTILMAAVPFTAVKEKLEISDAEIKAKYDEMKKQYPDMFESDKELRSIKYIAVNVTASKADEEALREELTEYASQLATQDSARATVREARSQVIYNNTYVSKNALPRDIANQLDSLAVGTLRGPYTNLADNTMNVLKFFGKVQQPDSVQYSIIGVAGTDAKANATADSILNALNAGAPMDTIAKRYNQSIEPQWLTSAMAEQGQLNDENRMFVNTLFNAAVGNYQKIETSTGKLIVKVSDRRNVIDKYNVAVIKRDIDFSKETYGDAYNKLQEFMAKYQTQAEIEENAAKNGYSLQETQYMAPSVHRIANLRGTTDALRWVFDEAKQGDVSKIQECGENNDAMLVVIVDKIHKKGDRDINDPNLHSVLEQEVAKDRQAELLLAKFKDTKSIADVAKLEGAVQDTIRHITFSSPVFVQKLASSEPALTGAVAASKKGQFQTGVRGQNGVYAFQVLNQEKKNGKLDEKAEESQLSSVAMRNMNGLMSALLRSAQVQDRRYKMFN